jgi:indole-3-glycerol phosphate synthase
MNILQEIVTAKIEEIEERKKKLPESILVESPYFIRLPKSLSESIRKTDPGIIAEFKRKSPSKSDIQINASTSQIIPSYVKNGAAAVSILTDNEFFGGSIEDVKNSRAICRLPILRKDFILNTYQILESKAIGADAILLIAEILSKKQVLELSSFAFSLGLETLLEVHSEDQLEKICDHINVIGVNNRNLRTFETSIENSKMIYPKLPKGLTKISESGLDKAFKIKELMDVGYDGFLIGEYFMKEEDPGKKLSMTIKKI